LIFVGNSVAYWIQKQSIHGNNHKNFLNIPNFEQSSEAGVAFLLFTQKDRAKNYEKP